jgi:hypothetical protein
MDSESELHVSRRSILEDVFHLMKRIAIRKKDHLRAAFFRCFRQSMFLLDKNGYRKCQISPRHEVQHQLQFLVPNISKNEFEDLFHLQLSFWPEWDLCLNISKIC